MAQSHGPLTQELIEEGLVEDILEDLVNPDIEFQGDGTFIFEDIETAAAPALAAAAVIIFQRLGISLASKRVIHRGVSEVQLKVLAQRYEKGLVSRIAKCLKVDGPGKTRMLLTRESKEVLFVGSHEDYNKFYAEKHFNKICRKKGQEKNHKTKKA